jgi:hypothetical protein
MSKEDLLEKAADEYFDQLEGADLKERIFSLIDEYDTAVEVHNHAELRPWSPNVPSLSLISTG